MHLALLLLEIMQLPIERPVCGDQIHWLYVSSGSVPPARTAGKQSSAQRTSGARRVRPC